MPELPEIEAFARAQRERLTEAPIESVPVAHFATVKTIEPPMRSLEGQQFTDVTRRAKRLLLPAPGGQRRAAAWLWSPAELEAELAHTGPEPLDPAFTPEVLREAMQRRPGQLHAFLRDQRNV